MTQNIADQLDLTIYSSPFISWWRHPLILLGFALLFSLIIIIAWSIKRHFRKKIVIPFSVIALELLKKGRDALISGKIAVSEAVVLLTTILKSYTAWLTKNDSVNGMTDHQWLAFVKTLKQFEPYYNDFAMMVETANQIKFNYAQLQKEQIVQLFEKAIQIIDVTQIKDKN